MTGNRHGKGRKGVAFAAAFASVLVALPSAGLAVDGFGQDTALSLPGNFANFTPASVDPRMAEFVSNRVTGKGRLMRFTPAGMVERGGKPVTVAVRVSADTAQAITVRSTLAGRDDSPVSAALPVRIAPTRYNLGLARGYQKFATPKVELDETLSAAAIPDLATFRPTPGVKKDPSRFGARIALEQGREPGTTPRTRDRLADQSLDVAGSYRITDNLNVTAGVRYEQDRDRLDPVTDSSQQDSQAVYVGTQFRF
ncbi:hypothetical protein [Paraurantiacibacter namhicola]|uniref:Porin domain-containing protein n=1 Tax=Paraurantiacibacter namhicola TaxID=645517 RepID=A0A1C7D5Z6_9SPHN|nr:hypothetical protein [Paraurantiacibacter namhicola]ANU06880.1 hypothetical protein A6F65_00557 [Paraurantiacibacter namhicola]